MPYMIKALFAVLFLLTTPAHGVETPVQSLSLEKAKQYIDSNKPAQAFRVLSEFRPSNNELPLYHHYYAKAYELSNRKYDAIAHLRLAYLYSPEGALKEDLLTERAEVYFNMGFFAEAAMSFRIALRTYPGSHGAEKAYLGLADSLYRLGNYGEAREFYEKAGGSLHALCGRANALNAMGKYDEAYTLYQEIIGKGNGFLQSSQETLYCMGKNLIETGDMSTAKSYLTSVTDPVLKYRAAAALGQIASQESQTEAAVKHFTHALQSPERGFRREALLSLADLYIRLGKLEEAKSRLLEIRNHYPYGKGYDTAILMLFRINKKEGNTHEAVALMKELVLRKSPDQRAVDEFEDMILEAKERDNDELLTLWKTGGNVLLDPRRSDTLLKIAPVMRDSGRLFLDLCRWLSQHGDSDAATQGHLLLADFYADMGDAAKALWHLQKIPAKSSNDEVSRIKAKTLYAGKDYQRAIETVLSIKDIKPEDILLLSDLSQWISGNRKALAFYEKGLIKADAYPKTYVRFADILHDSGRASDSLQYYKAALSLHQKGKELTQGELEWSLYRVSTLSQGEESADALKSMQKWDDIFRRFSKTKTKEANLNSIMNRIF
jgi:tetratricopeptide (TPR) repeat protein